MVTTNYLPIKMYCIPSFQDTTKGIYPVMQLYQFTHQIQGQYLITCDVQLRTCPVFVYELVITFRVVKIWCLSNGLIVIEYLLTLCAGSTTCMHINLHPKWWIVPVPLKCMIYLQNPNSHLFIIKVLLHLYSICIHVPLSEQHRLLFY